MGISVRRYGWDSWLLEVDDPAGWFLELTALRSAGDLVCAEIVPAARTVLLREVSLLPDLEPIVPEGGSAAGTEIVIPVWWDGADLEDVARRWGDDPADVMRQTEFAVAFCGFAPGFAYLSGLTRAVPRLDTPRASVPKGSVAVAGAYAGVYPQASPGGWRLLGRTDVELFDLKREKPALLEPGTRVRFVEREFVERKAIGA